MGFRVLFWKKLLTKWIFLGFFEFFFVTLCFETEN